MKFLIGADPELFVTKGGSLVSGHGLIPGTKDKPFKVNKGAVQVDGMALEFNIEPANTEDEFVTNINTVIAELAMMVPGFDIHAIPVADFGAEYIASQPRVARDLGCTPDYNAWEGGSENPRPDVDTPFRTASGHIHIGWTADKKRRDMEHNSVCCQLVKQLDFYLGLPSLFYDKDERRRSLYGKAGAFRPKPYGVEYRVLSNVWLKDENTMRWVYRTTQKALSDYIEGRILETEYGNISQIINTSDRAAAQEIIAREGLEVPNAA